MAVLYIVGFLVYVCLIAVITLILVFYYAPRIGHKNCIIYILICSGVGSLTVMACKGAGLAILQTIAGKCLSPVNARMWLRISVKELCTLPVPGFTYHIFLDAGWGNHVCFSNGPHSAACYIGCLKGMKWEVQHLGPLRALIGVGRSSIGKRARVRHASTEGPKLDSRCCLLTTWPLCHRCAPTCLQLNARTTSPLKSTNWVCDKTKSFQSF